LVLLGKIRFQEEEVVGVVLQQRQEESKREQLLGLFWVGCDGGAKGTELAYRRRGENGMDLIER
jgi:hypothetical protein